MTKEYNYQIQNMKTILKYLVLPLFTQVQTGLTDCLGGKIIIDNHCICPIGTFETMDGECDPCKDPCLACTDLPTKCLACNVTVYNFRVDRTINFRCDCLDGYFDNSGTCEKCQSPCLSCKVSSTTCLTCNTIFDTAPIAVSGSCVCKDGYYFFTTKCQACPLQCLTCALISSQIKCFTCSPGYYLDLYPPGSPPGSCFPCPSAGPGNPMYFDGTKCLECDKSCKQCDKSPDKCISCDTNVPYRIDMSVTLGKCPCINGYYTDGAVCKDCLKSCYICLDGSTCTICMPQTNRELGLKNECLCKAGYFETPDQVKCQKCDVSCKSCSLKHNLCSECSEGYKYDYAKTSVGNAKCYLIEDGCYDNYATSKDICIGCGSKLCKQCFQPQFNDTTRYCSSCQQKNTNPPDCLCREVVNTTLQAINGKGKICYTDCEHTWYLTNYQSKNQIPACKKQQNNSSKLPECTYCLNVGKPLQTCVKCKWGFYLLSDCKHINKSFLENIDCKYQTTLYPLFPYFNEDYLLCLPCHQGCAKCAWESPNKYAECLECEQGFLHVDGDCKPKSCLSIPSLGNNIEHLHCDLCPTECVSCSNEFTYSLNNRQNSISCQACTAGWIYLFSSCIKENTVNLTNYYTQNSTSCYNCPIGKQLQHYQCFNDKIADQSIWEITPQDGCIPSQQSIIDFNEVKELRSEFTMKPKISQAALCGQKNATSYGPCLICPQNCIHCDLNSLCLKCALGYVQSSKLVNNSQYRVVCLPKTELEESVILWESLFILNINQLSQMYNVPKFTIMDFIETMSRNVNNLTTFKDSMQLLKNGPKQFNSSFHLLTSYGSPYLDKQVNEQIKSIHNLVMNNTLPMQQMFASIASQRLMIVESCNPPHIFDIGSGMCINICPFPNYVYETYRKNTNLNVHLECRFAEEIDQKQIVASNWLEGRPVQKQTNCTDGLNLIKEGICRLCIPPWYATKDDCLYYQPRISQIYESFYRKNQYYPNNFIVHNMAFDLALEAKSQNDQKSMKFDWQLQIIRSDVKESFNNQGFIRFKPLDEDQVQERQRAFNRNIMLDQSYLYVPSSNLFPNTLYDIVLKQTSTEVKYFHVVIWCHNDGLSLPLFQHFDLTNPIILFQPADFQIVSREKKGLSEKIYFYANVLQFQQLVDFKRTFVRIYPSSKVWVISMRMSRPFQSFVITIPFTQEQLNLELIVGTVNREIYTYAIDVEIVPEIVSPQRAIYTLSNHYMRGKLAEKQSLTSVNYIELQEYSSFLVETLKLITGITEDAEFECKFDRNQEDICSGNGICEAGLEHNYCRCFGLAQLGGHMCQYSEQQLIFLQSISTQILQEIHYQKKEYGFSNLQILSQITRFDVISLIGQVFSQDIFTFLTDYLLNTLIQPNSDELSSYYTIINNLFRLVDYSLKSSRRNRSMDAEQKLLRIIKESGHQQFQWFPQGISEFEYIGSTISLKMVRVTYNNMPPLRIIVQINCRQPGDIQQFQCASFTIPSNLLPLTETNFIIKVIYFKYNFIDPTGFLQSAALYTQILSEDSLEEISLNTTQLMGNGIEFRIRSNSINPNDENSMACLMIKSDKVGLNSLWQPGSCPGKDSLGNDVRCRCSSLGLLSVSQRPPEVANSSKVSEDSIEQEPSSEKTQTFKLIPLFNVSDIASSIDRLVFLCAWFAMMII